MKWVACLFVVLLNGCSNVYELAFVSDRNGQSDIYLTDINGKEVRQLTQTKDVEYGLTWTSDGTEIYYTLFLPEGRQVGRLVVADGKTSTVLNDSTLVSLCDVSRNKKKLLVASRIHHAKGELYVYDIPTQTYTRLTDNDFFEAGAKFSPDETSVVAAIQTQKPGPNHPAGMAEIFRIELSSLTPVQLTHMHAFNGLPDWSPDGSQIAFHSCNQGKCDVYVMEVDGSGLTNITAGKEDNRWPRWTPDGKWIAFTKSTDGNSDIWFASPDGATLKPIITSPGRDEIAECKP
ncbi:MAG: PD40 domain-containing protein [Flavobacteriales bacterium]|nr:PD40 domain-containing protein [Flavobacteriales bacterium]MCB9447141.1 PD40 domain-containing protein [Flavobacteriales bacterium]